MQETSSLHNNDSLNANGGRNWQEIPTLRSALTDPHRQRYSNYSSISHDDPDLTESEAILTRTHSSTTRAATATAAVETSHNSSSIPSITSLFKPYYQTIQQFFLHNKLYISIILLIISTASERVTFKFMIDRMLPFKFILIEIIFLLSFLLFSMVTLHKIHKTKEITNQMRQFPHRQIFIMAGLDSLQFLGLVYSGVDVSPTMTVILMHTSTLFVVGGSRFIFPHRNYSNLHRYGLALISLALVIGMLKILWCDWSSDDTYYATRAALIYTGSSALQGLSTLYKESSLVTWAQPVNIYYLSSFLFLYQFLITICFSVIFYLLEDISGTHVSITNSMYYGWRCFVGITPKESDVDDIATCTNSLYIIVGYVLSTFIVIMSINSVVQIGNQTVGRAVAGSVLAAFIVLWFYDYLTAGSIHSVILSCHVSVLDVLAIIVLLAGMEVYGRDPEPDVEIITNYPSSPNANQQGSNPTSPA